MKKFKNKLAVTGSKSLLKAFEEEVASLGYKIFSSAYYTGDLIVNNWGDEINVFSYAPDSHSRIQKAEYKLTLPQDWDLALKLAAEVEEEIPEYVEATKDYNGYFISGYIYKVNNLRQIRNAELICNVKSAHIKAGNYMYVNLTYPNWKPSTKEAYEEQGKPKFKEGDWLYEHEALVRFNGVNDLGRVITKEYYHFHGDKLIGEGKSDDYINVKDVRLATDEEIKRILTKVAEIKYPIGTRIKPENLNKMMGSPRSVKVTKSDFHFAINPYQMWVSSEQWNSIIYKNGKWAEIVEDSKLVINGYEVVKINDYTVKIGCQQLYKLNINDMKHLLDKFGGTYVYKDNTKWTVDDLDKILSVFD